MDFRILGPLEVVDADRQVTVGAGKQRALLAVLLLSANRVVPSERLIDELWGEAPPATAAKSVQVYVSQLRKVLRNGNGDGRDGPLLTRAGGYVLRTVSEVDPRSLRVRRTLPTGAFPSDLAAGGDSVYVVDGARRELVRIQPAYGRVTRRVPLSGARRERAPPTDRFELDPTAVAVGAGSVCVSDGSDRVARVDARTMSPLPSIPAGGRVTGVAVGSGAVWAITAPAGVIRIDPRTGRVTDRIRVASRATADAPYPVALATGGGFVWVLEANTATVRKIEPRTGAVVATTPIGVDHSPTALAAGDDAAWVTNADGTLVRIDAGSGAVRTIAVGHGLRDVAVADGMVWVTNQLTRCCGQE